MVRSISGLGGILVLLILSWLGLFSWLIVSVYQQNQEWESFRTSHKCELVRSDVSFWGNRLTYRCDDGVVYTRDK